MQNEPTLTALRRSSRVPTTLPILVTSMAADTHFSEVCKTLVVNAHGCAVLSPVKFDAGVPLRFRSKDGRETTARVVSCEPIGHGNQSWRLGAKLDRPQNFWGLSEHPADWAIPADPSTGKLQLGALAPTTASAKPQANLPPEVMLDMVARRLEAPLRKMIAESMSPLQAEVAAIREKLAQREANPSRFEVSLSQIPPELERQLEQRLKQDLAARISEDSRNQYAHLLEAAKATLGQRTNEGYEEFRRRASEELKRVEQRSQEFSTQISASAQEQVRLGLEDFHQKLMDGGNSLKRLVEELMAFLQHSLADEHGSRLHELEQVRSLVATESSRLQQEVKALGSRIANLDQSARSLESGLDSRLGQMSANTVRDARAQLESMANEALAQLAQHSSKALGDQLDEAGEKMLAAQKSTVAALTDALDTQVSAASQSFERSMDESARLSVERWRMKLVNSLSALLKGLGEDLQS